MMAPFFVDTGVMRHHEKLLPINSKQKDKISDQCHECCQYHTGTG
jgi:hypothetical protein